MENTVQVKIASTKVHILPLTNDGQSNYSNFHLEFGMNGTISVINPILEERSQAMPDRYANQCFDVEWELRYLDS